VVLVSVGYIEPGLVWDIDAFNKATEQSFGYSTYGYWPWHNTEGAGKDCDEHPASVFTLIYAANAEGWKVNLAPIGAAAEYVKAGRVDALPSWYTLGDYTIRDRILEKGYRGPLSWYKAAIRNVNAADEAAVSEDDRFCKLPTLLIVSEEDYVTRADMQIMTTTKLVPDLRIETLPVCGHWIQLERADELHCLLERFAAEVTAGKHEQKLNGYTVSETTIIDSTNPGGMLMPINFNWGRW